MSWRNVCVVATMLLAACVGDQKAKNGAVQLVNAVPDGPRLNLVFDASTTPVALNLDYRNATGLIARGAGPVHITVQQVLPAGNVSAIDLPSASLAVNDELTIVVVGTGADTVVDHVDVLNKTSAVPAGQTRVQAVHAAAGFPAVDVYVTDNSVTSLAGLAPIASIAYKTSSARALVTSTTTGRIRLTPVGDPATLLFDSGLVQLAAEGDFLFTVLAHIGPGSASHPLAIGVSSGVSSSAILDQAVPSNLRVVHASPTNGAVNVKLTDTSTTPPNPPDFSIATGLAYLGIVPGPNAYLDIPGSTYTTAFFNPADSTTAAQSSTGDVYVRGGSQTLVLDGLSTALGRLVLADDVRRVATEGRVRIVDVAPSSVTGALDVYIVPTATPDITSATAQLASGVVGSGTGYLPFAAGSYDIIVTAAGSKTDIRLQQTLAVELNKTYSALIVESPGGGAPLSLLGLDDLP